MTTLTLRWAHADHHHERTIAQGEAVSLGRSTDCEIRLPTEDRTIHRRHAEISWDAGSPVLNVVGRNGVRLDSARRKLTQGETARIAAMDRLTIGESVLDASVGSARAGDRKLRCHHCGRVQDYAPEGMCIHCGFALASAETVFIQE